MRLLLVAVAIGACLWMIRAAAIFGVSRLVVKYALSMRDPLAANQAVELTPLDADAHLASAALMSIHNPPSDSIIEMERAVALRPADYALWMQLGLLRDRIGDTAGALAAFDQSIKLAPFYAKPRWLRGNLLVRSGQYDSAFIDLNQAAQSDPQLNANVIDLAWGLTKGDPKLTEQLARVDTPKMRIAFATLLAQNGKGREAVEQFRLAGTVPTDIREQLLAQLLSKGSFAEAFEVWRVDRIPDGPANNAGIYDGGFEGVLSFAETGFGWKVPRGLQVNMSQSSAAAHSGANSLSIEFTGDSGTGTPLISQLLLVEPSRKYQINFAARSQDIVTGGLPVVFVNDAASGLMPLAHSLPLSRGTVDWRSFSFQFSTQPTTRAVVLSIQREGCASAPCPIFGAIELDSFSIEQLK